MRIMLASDGSNDGLDALEQAALLGGGGTHEAVTIVVGWPPREGELWRSAFERQAIVDDLHRAVEETVEGITERLRRIAGTLARAVQSRTEDGDAVEQLAAAAELERIDLLIVASRAHPSAGTRRLCSTR
jgi:nucleotide-binding universal stress UspA family protein